MRGKRPINADLPLEHEESPARPGHSTRVRDRPHWDGVKVGYATASPANACRPQGDRGRSSSSRSSSSSPQSWAGAAGRSAPRRRPTPSAPSPAPEESATPTAASGGSARLPDLRHRQHDARRRRRCRLQRRLPWHSPSIPSTTAAQRPAAVTLVDEERMAGGHRSGRTDGHAGAGAAARHCRRRPARPNRTGARQRSLRRGAKRPAARRRSRSARPRGPGT